MTPALAVAVSAAALLMLPGRAEAGRRLRRLGVPVPAAPLPVSRPGPDPLGEVSALDLLASCLRAGLPAATAVGAVGLESPEPLASTLRRASDLLALGADPAAVWDQPSGHAGHTEDVATALARLARRSARSGSGLATAVAELAQRRRAELEDAAAARAERAGVLIGGPLGLCFLPAFLCLGIVPVVIGLAGRVLEGGLL
ncbi:type II secretion system F family protein [Nocardia sp. NPDC059240]|uniref:type II secretion system F family protein n=1 Tax=Nocardia sp. NPDC059240 TaxID=3346786 RepID=UPI0036AEDEFB